MKRNYLIPCLALLAVLSAGRAFADHGALGSTQRDAWINDGLARLAATGYLPQPSVPFDQMTNLEAAESVARASEHLLAQAPALPDLVDPTIPAAAPSAQVAAPAAVPTAALAPAAAPVVAPATAPAAQPAVAPATPPADLKLLVEEYRKELAALGVDLKALDKLLRKRKGIFAKLSKQQDKALNQTGSEASVYSRGYVNTYRPIGGSNSYDASMFMDIRLRSVPVPKLIFDATVRTWATLGYYWVDPVQIIEFRTFSISSTNKAGLFQAGDFFRHYTPLTLWNPSEVYTLLEPRADQWRRLDREELVLMDHGNDWRLRGFRYTNEDIPLPVPVLKPSLLLDAMGGPVKFATTGDYANYWSGAQAGLGLFDHKLDLVATGLRFWDDADSAHVTYVDDFPKTWAQCYQIGGVNPRLNWHVLPDKLTVKGDWDGVTSRYNDDVQNGNRSYQDWASIVRGSVESYGVEVSGQSYNVGPNFYNPAAQSLRYTPIYGTSVAAPLGYVTNSESRDTGIIGYKDRFLFTDVGRPSFAAYDRMDEMIFPYGDATPNRQGFKAGLNAKLLKKGWLHPQAWIISAKEIEPNWVRPLSDPEEVLAVDSNTTTATARTFKGLDAALQLDLAAAFGFKSILALGAEYKSQTADLGDSSLKTNTIIGSLDLPPSSVPALLVPIDLLVLAKVMDSKFYGNFNKWFKGLDFNIGYRQEKGSGHEYGLNGTTLAEYAFIPDPTDLGNYQYRSFDVTRTEFVVGVRYQITKTLNVRGDWLQRRIQDATLANPDTTTQEWRMVYEASF